MAAGRARRLAVLGLVPILVAASDPVDDVRGCSDRPGRGAPDLVGAEGQIVELGTSVRWVLTFAHPLTVPDTDGRPFRVDVAIHDPDVPTVSFAYYRRLNRLVRVDATVEHPTEIYLLPERGTNVFNPAVVDGTSMTIQVPGRTLTEDEDLTGTSPGLGALRWTVIVRDGRACDFLADGRPTERLERLRTGETPAPDAPGVDPAGRSAFPLLAVGTAIGVVVLLAGYVLLGRRR